MPRAPDRHFDLDKESIKDSFNRAAASYDKVAVLQQEVGKRLVERLDWVKLTPEAVLDLGCGTGYTTTPLFRKYSRARIYGLDLAIAMLVIARQRAPWFRKLYTVCADAEALPLADASCDLIFSNLTLQWCGDLDRVFRECRRVLKPGGLLLFSTLGPDTLLELRESWAVADGYNHVNAFIDMHDVGDALIRSALAEPVLDVEHITLTYKDVFGLMRDLKLLGAHNVSAGRPAGLTGKNRLQAMQTAYEQFRTPEGLLPATYEVVYGHAWAPLQPLSHLRDDGAAVFALSRLQGRRGGR